MSYSAALKSAQLLGEITLDCYLAAVAVAVVFARQIVWQASVVSARIPMVFWPLLATLVVQSHLLCNGFLFDDFVHLYTVSNLPFFDAIRVPMGGHLIHTFTAVLWLEKALFGLNPSAFIAIGLLAHLASVWLLFGIIFRLTGRGAVAAFGATLWGISPFAAGTVGWISVHGHAYTTVALLWVLLDIIRCSKGQLFPGYWLLVRHAVLLLVATTSFGAGLVCTVVFPLIIWLWNPLPAQRFRLVMTYTIVALAAVVLYAMTMKLQGEAHDNLSEKVDIVRHSLANIPAISRAFFELLAIGSSGLLLGPLLVGKIAVVSPDALFFIAGLAAVFIVLPLLVWCVWVSAPLERRRMIALLGLVCASYGLIALARSSGFLPMKAEAPRYHYLAPALMSIVYCLVLAKILDRLPARMQNLGRIPYFIWLALVIVPFTLGPVPASKEANIKRQNNQLVRATRALEKALEDHTGPGDIYIRNRPFSVFVWGYTPEHFPGLAGLFVLSYSSNSVDGKRVFFVDDSEELVRTAQAQSGTRISELLIYHPKEKTD